LVSYPHPIDPRTCGGGRKSKSKLLGKESNILKKKEEGYVHIYHLYQTTGQRKGNGYIEEEMDINKN
jgi:hypothetical protein